MLAFRWSSILKPCADAEPRVAFDDQTSTFIIPCGGGFEVIFCPTGRSTTILATYRTQLSQLAQGGVVVGTTASKIQGRDGSFASDGDVDLYGDETPVEGVPMTKRLHAEWHLQRERETRRAFNA